MARWVRLVLFVSVIAGCGSGGTPNYPPVLVSRSPSIDAQHIDHGSTVDLIFSKPINHASITPDTFAVQEFGGSTVNGSYEFIDNFYLNTGTLVRFVPAMPLAGNSTYAVSVSRNITDTTGIALGTDINWSFTTAPEGTGSWTPTPASGAPPVTTGHTVVWTGSEMLVWGGTSNSTTVYHYDPDTDTWSSFSSVDAPSPRTGHTAVWTGSEMIIWGGRENSSNNCVNTGARYNPATNTWTAITTNMAILPRCEHTAVWTDSLMLIWGGHHGDPLATGYPLVGERYRPADDQWLNAMTAAPILGRTDHTAVWTGDEMIVWGGRYTTALGTFYRDNGARYEPVSDTWAIIPDTNTPSARALHSAVWTGTEMIIWGGFSDSGYLGDGGRYDPAPLVNAWTATQTNNAPLPRWGHSAVWTGVGGNMIVWGGYTGNIDTLWPRIGGIYTPGTDTWGYTTTLNSPEGRTSHTAVWTGTQMIVWGGIMGTTLNTGGEYTP